MERERANDLHGAIELALERARRTIALSRSLVADQAAIRRAVACTHEDIRRRRAVPRRGPPERR